MILKFLERGRNRVKLQEAYSPWKEQMWGCPPGSSFGPLLWNLFKNDLSLHSQSANLFVCWWSSNTHSSDNDIQKATQTLRRQTDAVSQWYKENLPQANPQKYQIRPYYWFTTFKETPLINIDDGIRCEWSQIIWLSQNYWRNHRQETDIQRTHQWYLQENEMVCKVTPFHIVLLFEENG